MWATICPITALMNISGSFPLAAQVPESALPELCDFISKSLPGPYIGSWPGWKDFIYYL